MSIGIIILIIIILITVLSLSAISAANISDYNSSNNKNTSITKLDTIITKNTDIVSNSNIKAKTIKAKTTIVKKYSSKNAAGRIIGKAAAGKTKLAAKPAGKTKPKSLSRDSILYANFLSTCAKNGKLPKYITINKYKITKNKYNSSILKFLDLLANETVNKKKYSFQNAAVGIIGKAAGGETKPKSLSRDSILYGANFLSTYVKENGKLPEYITINKYNFSIAEFLYFLADETENKIFIKVIKIV